MTSPDTQIVFRDEALVLATWRSVVLELWQGEGTVAHFRTLRAELPRIVERTPGHRISLLASVVVPSMRGLDAEMREQAAARERETLPHVDAVAIVLTSPGFVGAMLRSLVTGMQLTNRALGGERKVFDQHERALEWLAPRVRLPGGVRCSEAELTAAFHGARVPGPPVGQLLTKP